MDLVDVPASTRQLDEHEHLDVPHRLIAAPRPLEVGQVVVLRDLDGRHRWAAVDRLRFTETDTVYEMQLGLYFDGSSVPVAPGLDEETARRSRVRPA